MDTFTNAGLRFDVSDTPPADGDPVILLHGFPEDRHCWDGVVAGLSRAGFRSLAPDQRGYSPGARPPARREYTLRLLCADLLALADQAGAGSFHLVGHDWGAALAWYAAAVHPERVRSLATLSVPHPSAFQRSMLTSSQALRSWYMGFFQLPALPEAILSARHGTLMRTGLERAGLDPVSARRYAERAREKAMRGPVNWYRALPYGAADRIGPVGVPTLFVWSDGDSYVTRKAAEYCKDFVTGPYRYEVLAGRSHWLAEEDPEAVAGLLVDHLGTVTGH